MKIFLPVLLGGLLLLLVLGVMHQDVGAQCTYTLDWTFDASVPVAWQGSSVFWNDDDGHDALGQMVIVDTQPFDAVLTSAEILALLELTPTYQIVATSVFLEGYQKHDGSSSHRSRMVYTAGGVTNYSWNADDGTWVNQFINANSGTTLESIGVSLWVNNGLTYTAQFDDLQLRVPCSSVVEPDDPTPTPTFTPSPTPTMIPGLTTTLPAPTAYPTVTILGTPVVIPGPLPITATGSITHSLIMTPFWDVGNLTGIIQVVRTVPVMFSRWSLLRVLVIMIASLFAIQWMTAFVVRRTNASSSE